MPTETKVITKEAEHTHLPPRELLDYCLERRIKVVREEEIPLIDVITEEAIIDVEHADDLADSMSQEWGQLTPIGTRLRVDTETGKLAYDIFDGFHRTAGQKRRQKEAIRSTVVYGCNDEELYDLRILAASSVRSVQFARQAEWITSSFTLSKWGNSGLTVSQVFGLAVNDRATSYLVDLPPEQFQELKDWAKDKGRKWKKPLTSIYQLLKVVENADPELVKQVRTGGGLKDHTGRITQDRLASVVEVFPVQTNRAAQRAVLKFVVEKRMYAEATPHFSKRMAGVLTPDLTEEEMTKILRNLDDRQLAELTREDFEEDNSGLAETDHGTTLNQKSDNGHIEEEAHPLDQTPIPTTIDLLEIDEAPPDGATTFQQRRSSGIIGRRAVSYQEPTLDATYNTQYSGLLQDNHALRTALRAALHGENLDPSLLFRTTRLPMSEREIVEGLFIQYLPLDELCRKLRKTPPEVILSLQSALARYHSEERDLTGDQNPDFIEQAEDNLTSLL